MNQKKALTYSAVAAVSILPVVLAILVGGFMLKVPVQAASLAAVATAILMARIASRIIGRRLRAEAVKN